MVVVIYTGLAVFPGWLLCFQVGQLRFRWMSETSMCALEFDSVDPKQRPS